jgi:hypothetical protein
VKISTFVHNAAGGLCRVEVRFVGDDGEKDVRPPVSTLVKDEGGTILVQRAGYIKLLEELPESETEVRELLTRAIHEPYG